MEWEPVNTNVDYEKLITETTDDEDKLFYQEQRKWQNRRRMAWIAFRVAIYLTVFSFIGFAIFVWTSPAEKIKAVSELWVAIAALLSGPWAVVGAYMGFSTLQDMKMVNKKEDYKNNL